MLFVWPQALDLAPLQTAESCKHKDILMMLNSKSREALQKDGLSFKEKHQIVNSDFLVARRHCLKHQAEDSDAGDQEGCVLANPDCDLSGSHCNDHSNQGDRQGREGESSQFFLTHCKWLKQQRVPMAILENVTTGEFDTLACRS